MARKVCEDSTKADWGVWAFREYRRLLDDQMMAACRIYTEVELADLPIRQGKEAQGWLTIAHQDAERAREHIGEHIRKREGLQAQSAIGTPERSQLAEGVDNESKEMRSSQQRDSACSRTPSGTKVDLLDSTSESDTSDPGGMPQFFRGSPALGACPPKLQHTLPRRQDGEKVRSEVPAQEAEECGCLYINIRIIFYTASLE